MADKITQAQAKAAWEHIERFVLDPKRAGDPFIIDLRNTLTKFLNQLNPNKTGRPPKNG